MVDALREAGRVLTASGVLINIRPVLQPMSVEVVAGRRTIWTKQVAPCSTPEDVEAAEVAMRRAVECKWFAGEERIAYDLEIHCDTAADLRTYAQNRKLVESEIPYDELEQRRCALVSAGREAGVLCRRPWMLSSYRKE
jgi:hypothetical protein